MRADGSGVREGKWWTTLFLLIPKEGREEGGGKVIGIDTMGWQKDALVKGKEAAKGENREHQIEMWMIEFGLNVGKGLVIKN